MNPLRAQGNSPRQQASDPSRDRQVSLLFFVALLLLHIGLARVEKGRPMFVTLHGLAALGIALLFATNPRKPERTLQAIAYICGAEVFWRMCARSSMLPWEFGKYAVVAIMGTAFLRRGAFRVSWLPVVYFALLLPSFALTLMQFDLADARELLSANLSGPLAIAVALVFMSQVRLTQPQVCKALLGFIVPVAGVAFLCYSSTFGADEINFGKSSSKAAAGGLGANQVSSTLGLGILCALFWFLMQKGKLTLKALLIALILWFAIQSGLTFSRSGIYLTALSAFAGVIPLLRNARARWMVLSLAVVVSTLAYFVVLPMLDEFTGGALQKRFMNQDLTHRDVIMKEQLEMFLSNPLFGVGVGLGKTSGIGSMQTHTEYTRLLAEHGMFGLAALGVLFVCLFQAFRKADSNYGKALCFAMITFGSLFMAVSATRQAVPALVFGFASIRIIAEGRAVRRLATQRAANSSKRPLPAISSTLNPMVGRVAPRAPH
jgi:hypothetical protein